MSKFSKRWSDPDANPLADFLYTGSAFSGERMKAMPPTMSVPYGRYHTFSKNVTASYHLTPPSRANGLLAKEQWALANHGKGRKPRGCRHLTPQSIYQNFHWKFDDDTGLMEWVRND